MKNIRTLFFTPVKGIQNIENGVEFCYPIQEIALQVASNKDNISNEKILVAKLIDDETRFKRFVHRLNYYMEEFNGEIEDRTILEFTYTVDNSKKDITFSGNLVDVLTYLGAETALDKKSIEMCIQSSSFKLVNK